MSNLAVVLQPPATASGQVVDAATGQPIQEFQLAQASARYLEREASGPSVGWNRIFDPEGRFSVDVGIGRGAGVLIAKAEGYAPEQLLLGEVAPGQQITNLVFRLQSGAIVEGTVSDAAGNAVSGASIYQGSQERRGAAVARSDAGGAFRAEGLEAGSVELTASHPSYAPETVTVTTRLGAVTRADFVLSVGGAVEGYVTKGGQPVNRQTVSLNVGDRSENTVTGTDGYYSFERLPAGEGSVVVNRRDGTSSASQYLRVKRSIIIAENSVTRVDFEFAGENAVVEGVVTVEGGPASQAYIMLGIESGGGDQRTGTNVDANGYYRVGITSPPVRQPSRSVARWAAEAQKTARYELQAGHACGRISISDRSPASEERCGAYGKANKHMLPCSRGRSKSRSRRLRMFRPSPRWFPATHQFPRRGHSWSRTWNAAPTPSLAWRLPAPPKPNMRPS